MKLIRKLFSGLLFIGGAIFGLFFAQSRGKDLRKRISKATQSGNITDMLSKEAQNIGKDIWKSAVGMKDVKEVQEFIAESQARLTELGEDAKSYGGDVAKVLSKKYAEIAKKLEKQAKELEKSAEKKVKKTTYHLINNMKKVVKKAATKKVAKKPAAKKVAKKATKKVAKKPTTKKVVAKKVVKKVAKKVAKKPAKKVVKKATKKSKK